MQTECSSEIRIYEISWVLGPYIDRSATTASGNVTSSHVAADTTSHLLELGLPVVSCFRRWRTKFHWPTR